MVDTRAVSSTYVEALTVASSPPRAASSAYVEALISAGVNQRAGWGMNMASRIVQVAEHTDATGTTHAATFASAPQKGNSLLAFFTSGGASAPTLTGWTALYVSTAGTNPGAGTIQIGAWRLDNIPAGTSPTVTVTSATSRSALIIVEVASACLDAVVLTAAVAASGTVTAAGLTARSEDLCLAVVHGSPITAQTPAWDDGFASVHNTEALNATTGAGVYLAQKDGGLNTASGTVTATMSESNSWRGAQLGYLV